MAAGTDYNTRILHPLVRFIAEQHGEAVARDVTGRAGVPFELIDGNSHWIAQGPFEQLLEHARALFAGDEAFARACVHRIAESYGPIRYALWATSPTGVYIKVARAYRLATTLGAPTIVSASRTALHMRVESERPISRLNCLLRQAHTRHLPTFWGLPPAMLRESACVALGNDACEYHLRYFDSRRWLPVVLGAALGAALAAVAARFGLSNALSYASLPLLGATLGFALEQQRTARANLAVVEEHNAAMRAIANEESETRRELLAMHQRQREWTQMLEEDAAERAASIEEVVDALQRTREARDRQLRGFSHDLRSPLSVIRLGTNYLAKNIPAEEDGTREVIVELEHAAERMQQLLTQLMAAAAVGATVNPPERIEVPALAERLQRRLRAIVYGRDIRVSVVCKREAPPAIQLDPLLLDRITDNLLGNAAKYTERGTIVLEVEGVPDFLVLKISDTGRGIAPSEIERVFSPGGSDKGSRVGDSYGLGLSVVVQLLAQIGGRLEVMSKPDVGTTFWVHLPVRARAITPPPVRRDAERLQELMRKVVTIRHAVPPRGVS